MWSTEEKEMMWAISKTIYINEFLWKGKIPDDVLKVVSDMDRKKFDGVNDTFMRGLYQLYQKDYNPIRKTIIDFYASGRDLGVAVKMFDIPIEEVLDYVYDFISRCWDEYFQELHEKYIGSKMNTFGRTSVKVG